MIMKWFFTLAAVLVFSAVVSQTAVAQDDDVDTVGRSEDVIDKMLDDFDLEDTVKVVERRGSRRLASIRRPRITGQYGMAEFNRMGLSDMTHGLTLFGGSVGMEQYRRMVVDVDIIRIKSDGIFFHMGRAGSMPTKDSSFDGVPFAAHTSMDALVFGSIDESGYGYALGENSSLRFLVCDNSTWTSVTPRTYAERDTAGWQKVRDFTGNVRFGSTMAPTIEWKMGSTLSLRASYSWTQVLPRHMFWYWAGSEIIEGVADGIAGGIVKAFGRSSTASLPVMNFILRNAVAYTFKELRRDKMNWPFDTAAPLNITSWNVGLSVTF
jgi:hypothetical protein